MNKSNIILTNTLKLYLIYAALLRIKKREINEWKTKIDKTCVRFGELRTRLLMISCLRM